ncbi:MAG TPA: LacI family DNA-binding transcriptional regulator [Candidatus Faecivicinus avistercoris]|nr:LacI family DNA-binding transcriptional regulator [Candidatus Faecivicinus avistercoris]
MIPQKLIAEKAGVSFATVSRALTHSAKVRPETLKRIRNAMLELGITDTENLFLGKGALSKMVLVVVGDICKEFFANIIVGLSDVLAAHGYSIVLCNSHYDTKKEMEVIRSAHENYYAGIVLITVVESKELVEFLSHASIPVVLVNRYIRSLDLDVVRIDNYRGGYLAAQHLMENGHRRIAHLAGPQTSSAVEDRLRGFQHAMQDNGLTLPDDSIVFGDLSRECGKEFANWLAQKDYTAAYIGNDYMAAGAVHQLTKLGRRVPEDLSIISFDDSPLISEDGLSITCIGYDSKTMGTYAAETLLKRIADPLAHCVKTICSPNLTIRGSVRRLER